ncbi:MAG: phosphate acyltransferase [Candidatus Petromonas sp.]|nr:phosphate acyltransferase [Candidatus Petromonas sp.]
MIIAIDVMGGDNAPDSVLKGVGKALNETKSKLLLVGNEEIIKKDISKYCNKLDRIDIRHTSETIDNDDKPVQAVRRKKDSSMVVALEMLRKKEVSAVISAGNTGALLTGSLLKVGRIKGIDRPALAPIYPTKRGFSLLIDAGANVDCKPRNLLEFAIMGSIYLENVLNVNKPKVGIVNIGTEEGKGNKLVSEAYEILKESNLNFVGNIEARDIPSGIVDVIVCDGFVGNVILKLTEGVAMGISTMLKEQLVKNFVRKIAALTLKNGLKDFKSKLDYTEHGGAPLLGVKGAVIKAHGSSDAKAIKNAIKYGEVFARNNVIESIEKEIVRIGADSIE